MKYIVTLISRNSYGFNGNRFVKDVPKEVSLDVFNAIEGSALFKTETIFDDVEEIENTNSYEVSADTTMNIVMAYSPNWAQYVKTEVYSLFKHNSPPVKVWLLSDTLGTIDLDPLCYLFGVGYSYEFIDISKVYKDYIKTEANVSRRFTKYTLYRLLLPYLLPEDVDRILYIDADAIVCGDIRNFYQMHLKENILAGAQDTGVALPSVLKSIGFSPTDVYINAGVTLIDLKKVRELDLQKTWLEMVNKQTYLCHDQDILNITCKGRVAVVPAIYNTSICTGGGCGTKIMHYAGSKPWNRVGVPNVNIWKEAVDELHATQLPKIPRRVHYCWFGNNKKPKVIEECLDSWTVNLLDYEFVEWNETNFDLTAHGDYVKEAAERKQWAFVTDYVRLWALYNYGGIYMDADVMVVKPLDRFLKHSAFTGHETNELLITATMGAVPDHPWIKFLLDYYSNCKTKFSTTPNTQTISRISRPLVVKQEKGFTYLQDDVVIYPVETFCSYDHQKLKTIPTNNAYAYHIFAGTWIGRTPVEKEARL